jgi:tripartite-type tricarboxylate transporter receptor subunit TctC
MGSTVRGFVTAAAMVAAAFPAVQAAAQSVQAFPIKAVRLLVGTPPGTPPDVGARVIADRLAVALGQPVIVENRPGAILTIALAAVAKADPDGHTLGAIALPAVVAPSLLRQMPYDTVRDLAPVRQLSWTSNLLVVRGDAPLASLADLVAAAKARPGQIHYASGGNGTPAHLAAELFRQGAGIDIRHVPFNGAIAGVSAVLGGQVDMMFATAPAVAGHIKAGKLRPLAASVPKRLAGLPEIPTMPELGFAEMDVRDWVGIVAPAATPRPVVARLAAEAEKALAQADVRDRLAALGMDPADSSPEAFGQLIGAELARWTKVVREAGIKAD